MSHCKTMLFSNQPTFKPLFNTNIQGCHTSVWIIKLIDQTHQASEYTDHRCKNKEEYKEASH